MDKQVKIMLELYEQFEKAKKNELMEMSEQDLFNLISEAYEKAGFPEDEDTTGFGLWAAGTYEQIQGGCYNSLKEIMDEIYDLIQNDKESFRDDHGGYFDIDEYYDSIDFEERFAGIDDPEEQTEEVRRIIDYAIQHKIPGYIEWLCEDICEYLSNKDWFVGDLSNLY